MWRTSVLRNSKRKFRRREIFEVLQIIFLKQEDRIKPKGEEVTEQLLWDYSSHKKSSSILQKFLQVLKRLLAASLRKPQDVEKCIKTMRTAKTT